MFQWDPRTEKWNSILTAPEGLIAMASSGRYVAAMGYFGHVIYQYDTRTKKTRSKVVGTVRGHVSRKLLYGLQTPYLYSAFRKIRWRRDIGRK